MEPLRPPLLKRLGTRHWVAIDCAAVVLVVLASALLSRRVTQGPGWADGSAIVLALVAAGCRRCWSRSGLVVVVAVAALWTTLSTSFVPLVALAFVMYTVAQRFSRRESLALLAGSLLVSAAGLTGHLPVLRSRPYFYSPGPILALMLLVVAGWAVGLLVAQQRRYADALAAQAQQRAAAELADARRALSDERLRIARELHDVLAHSMSVIAVQAGVANHVAAERPDEVRRALSSIEETSRGALREMRALLGVLRDAESGAPAPDAPTPALSDLEALLARTAEAGVRVELEVTGDRPPLSAGLELAIYRVVQESVTNVIKHARVDRCRVAIEYRPESVTLEVTDTGAVGGSSSSGGHGIAGMRERVVMYGGELSAGPLPGRGFRVSARFPLAPVEVSR
ncbi:signal transduction histidine kinase [Streptacidiphilus sp. MAP12-20]|uniref:sensor histidine kinase n=1 Tax=Streptacidiphilus sp. MAP12-20 TaxID=3156299 RepID=UPI003512AA64